MTANEVITRLQKIVNLVDEIDPRYEYYVMDQKKKIKGQLQALIEKLAEVKKKNDPKR